MSAKHHPPVGQAQGKKKQVRAMFNNIAPKYDLLNRVLSFGIDKQWRKEAIAMLRPHQPRRILDVATGTADLAMAALALDPEKVVGVDIAEEMLAVGREKLAAEGLADRIQLRKGDAERLPFSDAQFDAALVAFGVRNFENLERGLKEIRRVLRPGGVLVVLEFSHPRLFPIKQLYRFYGKHILPLIGRTVSKDEGAYTYLPESIAAFPDGLDFLAILESCGYDARDWKPLTFGVASLYKGLKV